MKTKSTLLILLIGTLLFSCFSNDTPLPPTNNGTVVLPDPITPGEASECGATVDKFKENKLTFMGKCYTLTQLSSGLEQGYWVMSGNHPLSKKNNFLQCNIYFQERPYNNGEFITTSNPIGLGNNNLCVIINDYSKFDSTSTFNQFISTPGQKIKIESTGGGIFATFDKLNLRASSGMLVESSGYIKSGSSI